MKGLILVSALALVGAACSTTLAPGEAALDTSTAVVTSAQVVPTSTVRSDQTLPTAPSASWYTYSTGLPSSTDAVVGHGQLGYLLIASATGSSVVYTSGGGIEWIEASVLVGPDNRDWVMVQQIVVTDREFVVLANTWSSQPGGSEEWRTVVFRSVDGVDWSQTLLTEKGAVGVAMVLSKAGLVIVGAKNSDLHIADPRVWLEDDTGSFVEVGGVIREANDRGWVEGIVADSDGILLWGESGDGTFTWTTDDFSSWTRGIVEDSGYLYSFARRSNGWLAVGSDGVWVSAEGIDWEQTADPADFATDAVSPGTVEFGQVVVVDGTVAAVSAVGDRQGTAWCYVDPADCGGREVTLLVSGDGRDWDRIDLPGEAGPNAYPEAQALLVEGKLAVVHTRGADLVISILDAVEGAVPITDGSFPDLPFEVIEGNGTLEQGVEYGYAVDTRCGLNLGEMNGVHWQVSEGLAAARDLIGWDEMIYGFITLVSEGVIEYRLGEEVIATLVPDPAEEQILRCVISH